MDADKDTTSPVSGGSPVPGGPAASGGGSLSSSPTAKAPGGATTAQPLPAPPPNFSGSSLHQDNNVKAEVSNKAGYLCHVDVTAEWDVPPAVIFSLFTYPDNSALFRDVKKVGQRKVVRAEPGFKVVELEQLGELVIMWIRRSYTTWLRVEEDSRHPAAESPLTIQFDLIKSDVLTKFSGQWVLSAVKDPATGEVVGTHAVLTQDVLPAGVPPFLQHVPLLGGLLRGVSLRAVRRVMEDMNAAVKRVKEAFAEGKTIDEFLRATCGVHDEVVVHQDSSSAVRSFAFDCDGEDDDDEKDSKKKKEQQRLKESPSGKGASLVGGSQPASPRSMRLASQTSLGLGPSPLGSAPLGSAPLPHQ